MENHKCCLIRVLRGAFCAFEVLCVLSPYCIGVRMYVARQTLSRAGDCVKLRNYKRRREGEFRKNARKQSNLYYGDQLETPQIKVYLFEGVRRLFEGIHITWEDYLADPGMSILFAWQQEASADPRGPADGVHGSRKFPTVNPPR
jgi:hypothetical protein